MGANMDAEAAILTFFKSKGSNDGKGVDILGGNIGDFTSGFGLLFSGCFDATGVGGDEYKEQGRDCQRQNGVFSTDEEHDDGDADKGQDTGEQVYQAIVDQLFKIGDVTGDTLNEVAFLLLIVPVQGEALEVVEQFFA